MSLDKERNDIYKPRYLYVEDYPLTPDEIKKLNKEQDDDDDCGVIIIEIL